MLNRRSLFLGAASLLAAPSIVRAASLMPVRAPKWGVSVAGSAEIAALQADANARMQRLVDSVMDRFFENNRETIGRAVADQFLGIPGVARVLGDGSFSYERLPTPDTPWRMD